MKPPIRIGDDGLPHCGWCKGDQLCGPHKQEVTAALNMLKTPHLLAGSQRDLRYVVQHKDKKYEERDAS